MEWKHIVLWSWIAFRNKHVQTLTFNKATKVIQEQRVVLQNKGCLDDLTSICKLMNCNLHLRPYTKYSSKMTTILDVCHEATKLLEENIKNLCDLELQRLKIQKHKLSKLKAVALWETFWRQCELSYSLGQNIWRQFIW